MATTWVAGTATARLTGLTLSSSLPASVASGDLVLAFVFARSALTPPAGWTLIRSQSCVGGTVTQTTYCYQKDSVAAEDAGASFSWAQATSNRMGVTYAVLRSDLGYSLRVRNSAGSFVTNTSTGSVSLSQLVVTKDQEIHLAVGSVINQSAVSSFTPTASNMTLWSGVALDNRLSGFRQELVEGESVFGTMSLSVSSANNGLAAIVVCVTEVTVQFTQSDDFLGADGLDAGGSKFATLLSDSVRAAAYSLWGAQYIEDTADGIMHVDIGSASVPTIRQLADSLRVEDPSVTVMPTLVGDMFGIAESLPTNYFRSAAATDTLGISGYNQVSQKLYNVLQSAIGLADSITRGRPVTAEDSIFVAHAISVAQALSVIEALGLLDVIATSAHFGLTQVERVVVADVLRRFFGDGVVDGVSVGSPVTPTKRTAPSLADALGVQHVGSPHFIFKVLESDTVDLTDLQFIRQILKPSLTDGVEVTAAYIAPNDVFTTWSVNAATGAVSRYDNFEFNSFAHFGQMHIAADSQGLYELNGVSDEGSAIIARVRSGLAQMAGSRFTIVRDAYIGMRSNGSFVLRVITGEGDTYNYSFHSESMKTTRVPLGKGMRTRYVAFELISKGDDFDLDAVEFIPLSSTRRV